MGGIWGLAATTSLENLPVEVRGLASGILQQGYAVGYLIAAVITLYLVPATSVSWRSLFWTASRISVFAAFIRFCLPESELFVKENAAENGKGANELEKSKNFLKATGQMLRVHWMRCIYAILLMTGFNFLSHGSQDLYPTYLETTKGFSPHKAIVGAIARSAIADWVSQYLGRRLAIIIFVCLVGAFIPLWILPSNFSGLSAGALCLQFGVQGAWGVAPIFLAEMSPPAFRATFPGAAYQFGNMISSASAQIEATGGGTLRTSIVKDEQSVDVPNYAKVQGILLGCVAVFVLVITVVGPENHGSHFEEAETVTGA